MRLITLCCVVVTSFLQVAGNPVLDGENAGRVCGYDKDNRIKVVGREQYPSVVHLYITIDGRERHCGGSIISGRVVLTAAHCLVQGNPKPKLEVYVETGVLHLDLERKQNYKMHDYVIHAKYAVEILVKNKQGEETPMTWPNDIALIWVEKRFQYSPKVGQIAIMSSNVDVNQKVGYILGWGATNKSKCSSMLLKGDLRVVRKSVCESDGDYILHPGQLCMKSDDSTHQMCSGDSGGPFMIGNKLVGVISHCYPKTITLPSGKQIKRTDPNEGGTVTDARFYSKWISDNLRLGPPKDRKGNVSKPPNQPKQKQKTKTG